MIEVSKCIICDGELRHVKKALVAPFLAARIWARSPFVVDLVQCQLCGFTFYNPRLDAAEERRLYRGYRSDEYQRMRYASEAWYTARFNTALGSRSAYEVRRRLLKSILSRHVNIRTIRRVLDYGGGRGDLVDGLIDGVKAFVYDISSVPPLEGVTPTTDPRRCEADLIINSNVLEHIGSPRLLVKEMLNAAPVGGLVFVEVPCESAAAPDRIVRRIAQIGIMALTRPRLAQSVLRPSALYMMHEHINYFTEQSLAILMRCCGGTVIALGSYVVGRARIAWCLATTA